MHIGGELTVKWFFPQLHGHKEDILSVAVCPPNLLASSSYDGEASNTSWYRCFFLTPYIFRVANDFGRLLVSAFLAFIISAPFLGSIFLLSSFPVFNFLLTVYFFTLFSFFLPSLFLLRFFTFAPPLSFVPPCLLFFFFPS